MIIEDANISSFLKAQFTEILSFKLSHKQQNILEKLTRLHVSHILAYFMEICMNL